MPPEETPILVQSQIAELLNSANLIAVDLSILTDQTAARKRKLSTRQYAATYLGELAAKADALRAEITAAMTRLDR